LTLKSPGSNSVPISTEILKVFDDDDDVVPVVDDVLSADDEDVVVTAGSVDVVEKNDPPVRADCAPSSDDIIERGSPLARILL
jgi:hypothetical protein